MKQTQVIKVLGIAAIAVLGYYLWERWRAKKDIEQIKKTEVEAAKNPSPTTAVAPSQPLSAKVSNPVVDAATLTATDVSMAPSVNAAQNVV